MRTETEFLVDMLGRLNRAGTEYMLTGSMASNYWGVPRTTHDLDFVLQLTANDVEALINVLRPGLFLQPESVRAAFQAPYQFNVLDEQSALKADFWLLQDSPFEQVAFGRRMMVKLFGVPAWIATAEDIIVHKLFWNAITPSDRQLQDAAGVYVVQQNALDLAYLHEWSAILGVDKELELLRTGELRPKST